jgi:tetratricopeptide (TPR) repeat protein
VYENDNYRLFRVTADVKPVFLTDHPPVYQEAILREHADDLGTFYSRIIDILSTYQTAVAAQARGDERGAIPRFLYCLDQAPAFTAARLGVGDSLLRLGKTADAFNAYNSVLQYAPDNTHALYYGAISLAYMARRAEARRLVDLLLTATAQHDIRAQALDLKAALDSGRPIEIPRKAAKTPAK